MIVVDTSAILAYMNSADTHHAAVRDWLASEADDLATTPLIVAEADHLVAEMGLGLADASLVALAERLGTVKIATLDERHFRGGPTDGRRPGLPPAPGRWLTRPAR